MDFMKKTKSEQLKELVEYYKNIGNRETPIAKVTFKMIYELNKSILNS